MWLHVAGETYAWDYRVEAGVMGKDREAAVRRQELRRSNAAVPHRNRYRELKVSGRREDLWDRDAACGCEGCNCAGKLTP